MATLSQVIFFSLIGGVFSLIGGFLLLSRKSSAELLAKYATPFAAGALLTAVFLDLLHEGIEAAEAETVLTAALIGIIVFFFAERFLHWFHHHHPHQDKRRDPSANLIIIGDTLHNALDGVAIAAAFLIGVPTGIVTTLAVAAHEVPQEIGDFGLLLNKGFKKAAVIKINIMSALFTTFAAVLTFSLGSEEKLPVGVLLGITAGFLLYIAMSDIIPSIHENSTNKRLFDAQPLFLVLGAVVVAVAIRLTHSLIDQ